MIESRLRCAGVVLALAGVTVGCRGEREVAERSEAGAIARAIELTRGAPREARGPFIEALSRAPCTGDTICEARRVCTEAYALERSAGEAVRAVRHAASTDGAIPPAAGELLLHAETDLARVRDLSRDCADREAALRRRYELR